MNPKLPSGTLEKLWSDPAHWRAYCFYCCKADPRAIVPKRNKWGGWTVNMARPSGWIALVLITGYVLVPILLIQKYAILNTWMGAATLTSVLLGTIGACAFLSSPKRYETGTNQ